jgi:hypothetical protein
MSKRLQADHWKVLVPPAVELEICGIGEAVDQYSVGSFTAEKSRLNKIKSILDPYYAKNASRFTAFMRAADVYKDLRARVEKEFNAQLVSNAWLKHHELYSEYGLITPENNMIFFNAELPGSGISMWNHNAKTMYPGRVMDWRASSLLADSKHAFGDYYGLFKLHRDKWLMGVDSRGVDRGNGDTMSVETLNQFSREMKKLGGATTYNHDAGISVDDDYNNQESANAQLHLGCALAAFMTLRVGGSFVAKQYTFFETFTWNLILIYSTLFDQFYICKPLSSRPTNSEIYLVGKGFRGISPAVLDVLLDRLANFSLAPLVHQRCLTQSWESVAAIERMCRDLVTQQREMIQEVVDFYGEFDGVVDGLRSRMTPVYRERADEWLRKYPILRIETRDHLPAEGTVSNHLKS